MSMVVQNELRVSDSLNVASARPTILLLDSGVGGLSVYDEVRALLPEAHYIYVFDNESFPYGEKSESFITERILSITLAVAARFPVVLTIVACNTASTVSLPALRSRFDFAVVGVVPAIKPAARLTKNGVVGLLATKGTVSRHYTHALVAQFASECHINMLGSSELVEIAEQKLHGQPVSLNALTCILSPWLHLQTPPDTVILGCTHFPLLKEELQKVLPEGTRLVDSGAAIARRAVWLMDQEVPKTGCNDDHMAFCTRLDESASQLSVVLGQYGFKMLKKLALL